ncbi:hypothetical protein TSOC_013028 [Tetrabaena socialis]|uniref:Potassium channel domain-containing protein n=1 Tax=Tetrabaena socialis TaxID=47790 RepID=A0A2J7ZLG5_9CHLO|nr:hypothetical protein TSOC_013028 [Tetrabaena socialis]|eukprot:PNH01107.1 hypothetical protein TSOC_013028 [Tetrabaena socialis]
MAYYSYSAGMVATFLGHHGIRFKPHSSRACMVVLYEHGIRAEFPATINSNEYLVAMSIQTCSPIAGPAFAETALQFFAAGEWRSIPDAVKLKLGYCDDVVRHASPDDLFEHIQSIKQAVDSGVFHDIANAAIHFNGIDPDADASSLAGAYFTRLYFMTVAATTTGFGDISPKSPRARALTMLLLILIVSYGLFVMINVAKLIRGRGA